MSINWSKFQPNYITLQPNVPTKLKLSNWRDYTWLNSPGIKFDVITDEDTPKKFCTVSKRLIRKLIPILQKAESHNKEYVVVIIQKTGEGIDSKFNVEEVDDE